LVAVDEYRQNAPHAARRTAFAGHRSRVPVVAGGGRYTGGRATASAQQQSLRDLSRSTLAAPPCGGRSSAPRASASRGGPRAGKGQHRPAAGVSRARAIPPRQPKAALALDRETFSK